MTSRMARDTVSNKLLALRKLGASAKYASSLKIGRLYSYSSISHYVQPNVQTEHFKTVPIQNECMLKYKIGSEERIQLKGTLAEILNRIEAVPIVIDGSEIYDKCDMVQKLPYNVHHTIACYNHTNPKTIKSAIGSAVKAQTMWDKTKLSKRISIWEKAADLIAKKYRFQIVAATMLGQGKTLSQTEMDVAELIDFMRINPIFLRELANHEPVNNHPNNCNHMILRGCCGNKSI